MLSIVSANKTSLARYMLVGDVMALPEEADVDDRVKKYVSFACETFYNS